MTSAPRKAAQTYRTRQTSPGLARFVVQALASDRVMIRALARRLAEGGPDAARIRATLECLVTGEPPASGGILAALRRSPLVGADLDLARPCDGGRETDL
ncbi:MAG: hypothetical protein ACRYGP_05985 [Janthinobacterium lividum]